MTITKSSGNVFKDLGRDEQTAAEYQYKSVLVTCLRKAVEQRRLTQTEVAELCGTDQPTISKVLRGQLGLVTTDRLFSWFVRLGCMVKISVDTDGNGREGTVQVAGAG